MHPSRGYAIGLSALVLLAMIVGFWAAPATAQNPSEPVPCEVAMVVGCVATVTGDDGTVSMTLRVSDTGGEGTVGQPAGDGEEETADGTQAAQEVQSEQPEQLTQPEDSDRPLQTTVDPWEQGGLKSNFGTSSIPISHYQIGADVTGWLGVPDPLDSFVASQTNWAFTTSTFLVLLATNALDWAFEFPLGEGLVGDAGVLAQSYTVDFFGFGLNTSVYGLALSVTMVVAGFKALTKGLVAAGSDVVVAFFAYMLLVVLTLTSGFGNAGLTISRLSSDLSANIATFAAGQDRQEACAVDLRALSNSSTLAGAQAEADGAPASANSSACSFGHAIQRSMIELPYQNLQWGQVLDGQAGKERCAAINLELLAEGPWGNDDEPRDRMRSAPECEENADFNHRASYIRLGIASANAFSTGLVTVLILMVAAMLLWQQIKLLFLTVTMPHALVMAILPGRSRALAWRWVELLFGVVLRTVILSLALVMWLSLFSLIVYEQLTLRGIFLSLFASVSMAVSGFWGLYKMSGLTNRRSGGTAGADGPRKPETVTAGAGSTSTASTGRSGTGRSGTRSVDGTPRVGGGFSVGGGRKASAGRSVSRGVRSSVESNARNGVRSGVSTGVASGGRSGGVVSDTAKNINSAAERQSGTRRMVETARSIKIGAGRS